MIVIDATSLARYILREDNREKIRDYLAGKSYSLTLVMAKVSNAIWKHYVLYEVISSEGAETIFNALKKLKDVVVFEHFEKHLDDAIKISLEKKISVYDALYLAQAKVFGSLLTSDEK